MPVGFDLYSFLNMPKMPAASASGSPTVMRSPFFLSMDVGHIVRRHRQEVRHVERRDLARHERLGDDVAGLTLGPCFTSTSPAMGSTRRSAMHGAGSDFQSWGVRLGHTRKFEVQIPQVQIQPRHNIRLANRAWSGRSRIQVHAETHRDIVA